MNNNPKNQMSSADICRAAEREIVFRQESLGAEPYIRDEIMGDHIFFNDGMPTQESTTFLESRSGSITFPCNKTQEEMSLSERTVALQNFWREKDKKVTRAFMDSSAGGALESQTAWSKRMGLKAPKNRDKRTFIDWSYWVQREERPSPSEIAWLFGDLYNPERIMDDEKIPAMSITEMDVDVLEMSWPEQRAFRWNNPEGYKAWVDALKTEMGCWFDESLVLPDYLFQEVKLERPPLALEDFCGVFEVLDGALDGPWSHNAWGVFK